VQNHTNGTLTLGERACYWVAPPVRSEKQWDLDTRHGSTRLGKGGPPGIAESLPGGTITFYRPKFGRHDESSFFGSSIHVKAAKGTSFLGMWVELCPPLDAIIEQ